MAIDTGRSVIRKSQPRHRYDARALIEAGKVMFAAENGTGLGGGDPHDSRYNNRYQPQVVNERVFHVYLDFLNAILCRNCVILSDL